MDFRSQLDLDSLAGGLDAMGGAVVQRDPVRKNIMGIESLDQEQGLVR